MKQIQILIVISSILLSPFLAYSESCDGFRDPLILNLLPYNVGVGLEFSSRNKLIKIGKRQKQSCFGNYKSFYIERYYDGADPWEFNLCDLQIEDEKTILFVLAKEGLFVLKNINIQDESNLDIDIVKDKAIERLLPLD